MSDGQALFRKLEYLKLWLIFVGEELWSHYAPHEIFSINCNADITSDGVNDCIGGGRAGVSSTIL